MIAAAPDELSDAEIDELQVTLLRLSMKLGNADLKANFARLCALAKRGIRQQGGEPHDVAEFYKDDAAEQRTAAQQESGERSGDSMSAHPGSIPGEGGSNPPPAVSAALTRERLEQYRGDLRDTMNEEEYQAMVDMALRYRDLLEQEPVAWRYKPKSGEKWWLTGGPPEGFDGWDIEKLIVAPGGE